jgi:hypothetical protein
LSRSSFIVSIRRLYAIFTPRALVYAPNLRRDFYDSCIDFCGFECMDIVYVALIVAFAALAVALVRLGKALQKNGARK